MPFTKGQSGNPKGRPVGSSNKPTFRDYFTEEERKAAVKDLKERMLKDPQLLKLTIEQLFGKAPQAIDVTTNGESLNGSMADLPNEKLEELSEGRAR